MVSMVIFSVNNIDAEIQFVVHQAMSKSRLKREVGLKRPPKHELREDCPSQDVVCRLCSGTSCASTPSTSCP